MANVGYWPMQAGESELKVVHGTFTGKATAAPTVVSGIVKSLTRSGAGALVVTLTEAAAFPSWKHITVTCEGTTGLVAAVTARNATARTISLQLKVGATATDATTGDIVYIRLEARNSNS